MSLSITKNRKITHFCSQLKLGHQGWKLLILRNPDNQHKIVDSQSMYVQNFERVALNDNNIDNKTENDFKN
jgi:hypothetical protein